MPWEAARIRAPQLVGTEWLNVNQLLVMEELLRGGVLLVDFWDYTCVNCLRTLPYLAEWYERYADLGLCIVGVHTPEFAFATEGALVAQAVDRLGIPYPVLLDNQQQNWRAFANRAWPSKYLIDDERIIRYTAVGEGRYRETEDAIQKLLREQHGDTLELPPLMSPIRPTDAPGAVCYRTTPELHAGVVPEHPDVGEAVGAQEARLFQAVEEREEGRLYFEGLWRASQEFSESVSGSSVLRVPYRAAEVNAVLATADGEPQRLYLLHDGQPLSLGEAGEDVVVDGDLGSYITVSTPRMYNLAINPDFARHEIALLSSDAGLRVYAFSFVSCTKPSREEGDIVVP